MFKLKTTGGVISSNTIKDNFQALEDYVNEKLAKIKTSGGQDNAYKEDLNMNNNNIINLNNLSVNSLTVAGLSTAELLAEIEQDVILVSNYRQEIEGWYDEIKEIDAAITKTFAPWQPEVEAVQGNISPEGSTLEGLTVTSQDGDTASAYYNTVEPGSMLFCLKLNKDTTNAKILIEYFVSNEYPWQSVAEIECQGEILKFGGGTDRGPITINQGDEVFISNARPPEGWEGRNIILVNGQEIVKTTYPMGGMGGFRIRVEDSGNSPSFTLIRNPAYNPYDEEIPYHPDSYMLDESKYPENPNGKGYEIVGLVEPVEWVELGKEIKNGDLLAFDNAGVPFIVNVTEPEEITAARVKQLYESNPDTNTFTDADVNKLANTTDKTLPINWIVVSTPTFTIEPEHAGKTLWVTTDCVITVSAYSTLPAGFNCEILKADSDLIVSVATSGSDTIRDGKSVIVSDAAVFKSLSAGVIGLVGDVQGVNGTVDAPSDGKAYVRKDGAWVEVDQSLLIGVGQPSITGSYITDGTTDNALVLTGVVSALALEAGDVIQITGSTDGLNDKLFTVETVIDDNSIVVNYEHAGTRGNGSLRLANQTTTVTITRITKWYNAPTGVGQGWVNMTGFRSASTTYTNTTGRPIQIFVTFDPDGSGSRFLINGVEMLSANDQTYYHVACVIPPDSTYRLGPIAGATQLRWMELR